MASRPTFVDLPPRIPEALAAVPSPKNNLSPRIMHQAGDVPPVMSPLDMFAAQGRLLQKQLEDSSKDGRRVSRLPPLMVSNAIKSPGLKSAGSQGSYFRSRSAGLEGGTPEELEARPKDEGKSGMALEVEEPTLRPKSVYPRMSGLYDHEEMPKTSVKGHLFTPPPIQSSHHSPNDYFSNHRPLSPEPPSKAPRTLPFRASPNTSQHSFSSNRDMREARRGPPLGHDPSKFAARKPDSPSRISHQRQTPSIKSVPVDSSDEEFSASATFSEQRKQSSSSGLSNQSPMSPYVHVHARSPSLNSEYSLGGSRLARPAPNFSRPISRGSVGRPSLESTSHQQSFEHRPSFDQASRQMSNDSHRFVFVDDGVQTPVSMSSEHLPEFDESTDKAAPSYIYTKYSLPRGRMVQRDSQVLTNTQVPRFEWDRPNMTTNVIPSTPPPDQRSISSSSSNPLAKQSDELSRASPRPSEDSATFHHAIRPPPTPQSYHTSTDSSASMRSGSTIKASQQTLTKHTRNSNELTPEDHLAKGIESHEKGNFKESTYHLRIAARHNLPTAMLLYALACRHGWGMRPNPAEGVQWLRRAADSASLEVAGDQQEQTPGNKRPEDVIHQKTRRAQFALSIYELGVSHMNGWGIEQDKALALRCFEIAANWGDADAMSEAGFCYYHGHGCKKDLKKAARYYRMAEAKGVSMVGNSW